MWFLKRTSIRLKSESIMCAFALNVHIIPLHIVAQNSWKQVIQALKFNTKHGCLRKIYIL